MDRVKTRFPGIRTALMLVALAMLVFASAAQAQTPAEDQYGSPTGSSMADGAENGEDSATAADPGSDIGAASGASAGGSPEEAGDTSGGVLPSTGGAPIYLLLVGTILLGTGATLWMGFRGES